MNKRAAEKRRQRTPSGRHLGDCLRGFADIHAHPMAHLAFGGHLIWGRPVGPFHEALTPCNGTDHTARSRLHFINIAKRVLDAVVCDRGYHAQGGYPEFRDWPSACAVIHQQLHIDWLRRAYEGGLRLMCALAVNNRLLGWLMENGRECWDDETVLDQVQAMCRIAQERENAQWMEVAYSAEDAERIISSNKLAIVLGAEVDQIELFLGHDPSRLSMLEDEAYRYLSGASDCAPDIEALAQAIYNAGLRQVTPLHFMDNAFGGAALHCDRVSTNIHWLNLWSTGHPMSDRGWPSVVAGPRDVEARLQRTQYAVNREWSVFWPPLESATVKYDDRLSNHINARGLTAAGTVLLINLWRRGILVDVDHMSLRTKTAVLALAEQHGIPVVSSHCWIRDISLSRAEIGVPDDWWMQWDGKNVRAQPSWPTLRHEGMHTHADIERIARLGGLTAPLLNQPAVRKPKALRHVSGDGCELTGTTTAAAAAYLYVVNVLGSRAAVPIGSDVNGLAPLPTASVCCPGSTSALYERGGLARPSAGNRIWNVNTDGVAHYGMLPDLIWRWRAEGMSEADLAPLFRSAQGYVETWARAEAAAPRIVRDEASLRVRAS